MAYTVERPPNRKGKVRYTGMFKDVRGRWRSAGTYASERQALSEAQRAELAVEAGRIGDPQRGKQSFAEYVEKHWLPNHMMELTTRQNYTYLLERYVLPEFGLMRIAQIMPGTVREWIVKLQGVGVHAPTIRQCKVILDAVLATALNDQITYLHAGKGVKTPPVPKKPRRIITAAQFDALYAALPDSTMRLLVETDIESGLRWGELTELRVKDLDQQTGMLTVARVVVCLSPAFHPEGKRFLVKHYPKDKEWRQLKLPGHLTAKLTDFIALHGLGADDLLFRYQPPTEAARRTLPDKLPDPDTLGWTEPNAAGRVYRHGTATAYGAGKCRCQYCRDVVAAYRARRREAGKDSPRTRRTAQSDGHIGGDWFRTNIWSKAVQAAQLGFHITPHGLRHAHASWLLAGGADIQVVKERLGHGSITTTARYLGTLPGANDAALNALDAIRGKRGAPPPPVDERTAASENGKDAKIRELEAKLARFKQLLDE